ATLHIEVLVCRLRSCSLHKNTLLNNEFVVTKISLKMAIDLYYSTISPFCRSVILLAKTLGIQLNLKKVNMMNNETKTPEYLKVIVFQSLSQLTDDNGFVLWESRAILAYLVNKYGKDDSLYPKDPQKRAIVDQRLYFDLGTLYPVLRAYFTAKRTGTPVSAEDSAKVDEAYQLLDKFLEGQDWVAGNNITIADYALSVDAASATLLQYDISKYKNVTNWLARIKKTIPDYVQVQEEEQSNYTNKMTIDFYYSVTSPFCRSIILLAKTLGIQLNFKKVNAMNNETKTPEYLKMNPQHCIPTVVDNGFVLWESSTLLTYLVNKYGKDDSLYPQDPQKRATVDQRLYFDMGTLFPGLRGIFAAKRTGNPISAEDSTKVEEAYQLLDKFLEGQDWVAGNNITIADYALSISAGFASVLQYDISKYKNVTNWLARVKKTIPDFVQVQEEGLGITYEIVQHYI
ncbi:hypothetical protein L9F63_021753, partial [Diploptera punctata]